MPLTVFLARAPQIGGVDQPRAVGQEFGDKGVVGAVLALAGILPGEVAGRSVADHVGAVAAVHGDARGRIVIVRSTQIGGIDQPRARRHSGG